MFFLTYYYHGKQIFYENYVEDKYTYCRFNFCLLHFRFLIFLKLIHFETVNLNTVYFFFLLLEDVRILNRVGRIDSAGAIFIDEQCKKCTVNIL